MDQDRYCPIQSWWIKIDIARYNLGGSRIARSIFPDTILVDQDRYSPIQSWWVKNRKIDIARYNLGGSGSILPNTILMGQESKIDISDTILVDQDQKIDIARTNLGGSRSIMPDTIFLG